MQIEETCFIKSLHTEEGLLKMIERYKNKENHPFFGKTHTEEVKKN